MAKQQIKEGRNWYAIHTYSGYENAVMRNLRQRIESLGMEDKIFNVLVPVEKKIKIKGNKRIEEEEKIYPGYILVDMIVTDVSVNGWKVLATGRYHAIDTGARLYQFGSRTRQERFLCRDL